MNGPHYVCTGGCEGVADKAGVCQAADCEKSGQPLIECDCEEKEHQEKLEAKSQE